MKKLLDNFPTAGKSKTSNQRNDDQFKTQPTTEFIFEIRQLEYPINQRIGARTGHYFQKNDQDWYKDVESKIQHDPTTSSYIPSWVDRISVGSQVSYVYEPQGQPQALAEEPPIQKPSDILREYNISERIKQEKIQQETRRQSIGRVLTDSIINDLDDDQQNQHKLDFEPREINGSFNISKYQADSSVYQMLESLPFQTPSKISEFSGAFSRSKAQITFNLDISPILNQALQSKNIQTKQNDVLFMINNLPPLEADGDLKNQAYDDFFAKITNCTKSIVVPVKDQPSVHLFDKVLGRKSIIVNTQIVDEGPLHDITKKDLQEQKVKKQRKTRVAKKQRITDLPTPISTIPDELNIKIDNSLNQQLQEFFASPEFHTVTQSQNNGQEQLQFTSEAKNQINSKNQSINFTFQEEKDPRKRKSPMKLQNLASEMINMDFVDQIFDESETMKQQGKHAKKSGKQLAQTDKQLKKQQRMLLAQTKKQIKNQQQKITPQQKMDQVRLTLANDGSNHNDQNINNNGDKKLISKNGFDDNQIHQDRLKQLKTAINRIRMSSKQAELDIKQEGPGKVIFTVRVLGKSKVAFSLKKGMQIIMKNFHHLEKVRVEIAKKQYKGVEQVQLSGNNQRVKIDNLESMVVKFKFHMTKSSE